MPRLFISYRRKDSQWVARSLYDALCNHFGDNLIFMDVDTIEPGEDFVVALENAVSTCNALVCVIGTNWLTITDDRTGNKRLDNPKDFVRIEIATALQRNIRVIPVLVDGAQMPLEEELPDVLKSLTRRNALTVRHESFNQDTHRLIETLEGILIPHNPSVLVPESPAINPELPKQAPVQERKVVVPVAPAPREETAKPRHGLGLLFYFLIPILVSLWLIALSYPKPYGMPNDPITSTLFPPTVFISILNIIGIFGTWMWKKWGVYTLVISTIISGIIHSSYAGFVEKNLGWGSLQWLEWYGGTVIALVISLTLLWYLLRKQWAFFQGNAM